MLGFRQCVSFTAGHFNTQHTFLPSLPSFSHLLLYCELVLRTVFRGTQSATFKGSAANFPYNNLEECNSDNFQFKFLFFLGADFIFTEKIIELQNSVFHKHAQIFYFSK
jgi:hypothetical protein